MVKTGIHTFLLLLALGAAAWAKRVPSREELASAIAALEASLAELRAQLAQRPADPKVTELEARVTALTDQVAALAKNGDAAAKLEELEAAVGELREDAASKSDLKKYVRKPDEKEFKSRMSQELELRGAFLDLRAGEIAQGVFDLSRLGQDPRLGMTSRAILAAVAQLGKQLVANDEKARPRMLLRLYWEANRFISDRSYLFVNAMPELQLYVFDQDIDRVLIPRDAAHPRAQLGLIFKKAAAGVQLGRFGAQAGVLQFTYGAGFFVNPTNVFTPKNPLDPRREVDGVPAAKVDLALYQAETTSLTAQLAAIGRMLRNDVLAEHRDKLQVSGLAMLKLDTRPASLTAIGIAQGPDDLGRDHGFSFGGIASANPLGLTTSVEALWSEAPEGDVYKPELVASIQGFTNKIGANGTTYIVEYLFNGDLPGTRADANAELAQAVVDGRTLLVIDRLTRPLGRRHYASIYLEPSLTQRLRVNVAALVGFDEAVGALLRGGFDYEIFNFSIHAFGGVLVGPEDSEFHHHFIQSFGELAVFASF